MHLMYDVSSTFQSFPCRLNPTSAEVAKDDWFELQHQKTLSLSTLLETFQITSTESEGQQCFLWSRSFMTT